MVVVYKDWLFIVLHQKNHFECYIFLQDVTFKCPFKDMDYIVVIWEIIKAWKNLVFRESDALTKRGWKDNPLPIAFVLFKKAFVLKLKLLFLLVPFHILCLYLISQLSKFISKWRLKTSCRYKLLDDQCSTISALWF